MSKDYLFLHKIQQMNVDEIFETYIESQTGVENIEHPIEIKEALEDLATYIYVLKNKPKEQTTF